MEAAESYEVVVKCPGSASLSNSEDFIISLPHNSTVLQLKEAIQSNHPCRPEISDQRLVFAGKLLNHDEISLKYLHEAERVHIDESGAGPSSPHKNMVVHMVLKSGMYRAAAVDTPKHTELLSPPTSAAPDDEDPTLGKRTIQSPVITYSPTSVPMSAVGPFQGAPSSPKPSQGKLFRSSSGVIYYAQSGDNGQIIYTDISKALFYDGTRYYKVRAPSSLSVPSIPHIETPAPGSPVQQRQEYFNNLMNELENPRNLPEGVHVRRIEIDLGAVISFLIRLFLVIMIFAPGGDKSRLVVVGVTFLLVSLLQAGFLRLSLVSNMLGTVWQTIIDAHQRARQAAERPRDGNRLHQDVGIGEVLSTFLLSMFPADIPRRVTPEPNNENPPAGLVAHAEDENRHIADNPPLAANVEA